jgi:hypothetical protein
VIFRLSDAIATLAIVATDIIMVVSEVNIIAETRCCSLSQKLRRLLYTGSAGAADLRVPALLDRQFYLR